jgi:tRNA threonylcarbamoyladenosine biosynthesis protein TsaB
MTATGTSSAEGWILALDTGTPTASVAVSSRAIGRVFRRDEPARTHGPTVLVLVEAVLAEAGLSPQDLAAVACGRGPGSFTGLRIGMATAKGLCYALGVPLLTPSSLEGLARAAPRDGPSTVVACLDARRQEIFAAAWRFSTEGAPELLLPPMAGGPTAVAEAVRTLGPAILVGTGATLYRDELAALLGNEARLPQDAPQTPDAAVLADLASEALARGETADLRTAEPDYIRPSDAELNRDRRRRE